MAELYSDSIAVPQKRSIFRHRGRESESELEAGSGYPRVVAGLGLKIAPAGFGYSRAGLRDRGFQWVLKIFRGFQWVSKMLMCISAPVLAKLHQKETKIGSK